MVYMEFQIITIASWLLLFLKIVPIRTKLGTCPPPDYPKYGSYKPVKSEYIPPDEIVYTCENGYTLFGKEERKCRTNGRWTESTPFCDRPTKLKDPYSSSDPDKCIAYTIDDNPKTCFTTAKITGTDLKVHLVKPAPVDVVRILLPKGKANFEVTTGPLGSCTTFNKDIRKAYLEITAGSLGSCALFNKDIRENQWVTFKFPNTNYQTDYLKIQEKSDKANPLAICEIEVYVRGDGWCSDPPKNFVPNGRFQVSRMIASLDCAEGYNAKENTRIVCEKNEWTWSGPNPQCDEILCDQAVGNASNHHGEWIPLDISARKLSVGMQRQLKCNSGFHVVGKPDVVTCSKFGMWSNTTAVCEAEKASFKSVAIYIGAAVAVVIIFLMGLAVCLLYKKREVVVIYKPENSYATPPSLCASGTEAEYSTVYYDAMAPKPPMTPSRPPHLQLMVEGEYSRPVDIQRPADIAFGTIKSSAIYDGMD